MFHNRKYEKILAGFSLTVAATIAIVALLIRDNKDIDTNIGFVIAQFLTLTATLLGLDYKFNSKLTAS